MQKKILLMLSVLLVMITSVAYSALSTSLSITSEVKFRVLADIRVNSVALENSNGGLLAYESEYSKNTVSIGFTLPTSGSSISYRVHIDNAGDVDYSIYDILKTTNNSGLNVAVSGYNMRDVIPAKTSVDLILTYTTSSPSENIINVVNTFDFKRVFYVTYETGTQEVIPQQIKYQGVNLALTNTQPTKNGYTFSKWNTKSDGSGVNYNSGASYTVDDDVTLYARYNLATYNINYVLNGGTNDSNNPSTYTIESNNITLADATKTGYTFKGWTGNGTTTPTKNLLLPKGSYGDKTFTANFKDETDPEITVTSQDGTVNYLENTQTIDAAFGSSNGTIAYKINATDEGSGIDTIEYAITNSSTAPTTGWASTTNGNHSDSKTRGTYYLHVKATDQDGNEKVVTTKLITIRFRVAYYDYFNASTTVSENQYYTGTALTSRTPSAHNGYSFDGWYNSSALTTKTVNANTSYTPTGSIQLYGKWTPVNYNITYSMNNGTNNSNNPDSYNIESENITLAAPSKTLTFKGNYNATSGANAANGTVTIGSNTTKAQDFAGWTGSNGTTAQTTVTIPTGSTGDKSYTAHWTAVAGTVPTVTRTGYTCGWSTSSAGTTIEVASGGTFPTSLITEDMASTVNLYAVCNPNTYQLTINPNGGTYNSTTNNSTKTMTYDSSNNNDIGVPTRSGYTFDGWYIEANSKTNQLFNNTGKNTALSGYFSAAYDTGVWKKTSPVTVYAHWSKAAASLTNSVSPTTYIYDGTAKSPTETVKDGSTTLTNGTDYTISYSNNTNVGTATATITGKNVYNVTTKAYYTGTATVNYYINNAKITWDTNSCGTISGTSPAYVRKGSTGVFTEIRNSTEGTIPTVSKSGYKFNGWYDGTTKVINADGTIVAGVSNWTDSSKNWLITQDKTLKASCTREDYTITYSMNNGINNANNPSSYNTESSAITLLAPTKTLTFKGNYNSTSGANGASGQVTIGSNTTANQTFAGWTGSNGSTAQTTVTIPSGSTGNKSYTAHWTAVAGTLPTVTRTGYTCGWNTSSSGTTIQYASGGTYPTTAISEGMSSTINLYAVCTPASFTVTAKANGGSIASTSGWSGTGNTATKSVTYLSTYGTLPTVSRTGYTFNGWFSNNLFDSSTTTTPCYLDYVGKEQQDNNSWACSSYIKVENSETYIINPNSTEGTGARHVIYDDNKEIISVIASGYQKIEMPSNAAYVRVSYRRSDSEDVEVIHQIESSTVVKTASNHDINARWTRNDYSITYALNNGTVSTANPTTYHVESTAITLNNPTKSLTFKGNYNATSGANAASGQVTIGANTTQAQAFAGWSGTGLSSNTVNVIIPTGSIGNRSYTAHWTAVAGTVPTVTRTGYTCGWSTSSTGTTIEIASGGSYATSRITEGMSTTVNLYAVCNPNTYQLTINPNGGTYNSTTNNSTKTMTYDASTNNDIGVPTRSGYTFDGWYIEANSKTNQLFNNTGKNTALSGYFSAAYDTGVWKKTSPVTVYAHWSKAASSLTNSVSPTTYIYDGTAKSPTETVKDGSTTLTSGTDYTVAFSNNTNVGTATATITGKNVYNTTTKAYYTGPTTLTYYINNAILTFDKGSCTSTSGTTTLYTYKGATKVYTGIRETTTTGTIPTASKSGYTFQGWYTASSGGSKVLNANGTFTGTAVTNYTNANSWQTVANQTLYAQCGRDSYSITYSMNNGTNNSNNPSTYTVESAAITLAAPSKTLTFVGNYNATSGANAASGTVSIGSNTAAAQTFAGWTGSNGSTAQTTVTIPSGSTGNKSYTAHWTAVAGATPTVTRTGYTCGWNRSSTGTTIEIASGGNFPTSYISEGMASTVNLYAVCTPNKIHLTLDPSPGTGGTTDIWYYYGTSRFYSNAACTTEISAITRPTRTGYTLVNYHGDGTSGGNNGEKYIAYNNVEFASDLATDIYKDATMYASWAINNYDVTFDNNFLVDDVYVNTSRRTSYYSASTAPTAKTEVEDETAANGYYVEFTMPDGSGGGPYYGAGSQLPAGETYTWSVEVKASRNMNITLGHEQGGTKAASLTTSWQRFTNTFTTTSSQYKAFVMYGSTWNAGDKIYIRNLYLEPGNGSQNFSTSSKQYGTQLGTLPTPTRAGYTFEGWFTDPVGGTEISSTTTVPANNVAYYAHWTPNKYYLDLNGRLDGTGVGYIRPHGTADIYINGVQVSNDVSDYYSQSYTGSTYEVKDIKANAGYTYNGVYSGTLTGTIGSAQSTVVLQFSTNTYQITYGLNNGTLATANPSTYTVSSEDITLNNPTKTLTFVGHANATSGANAASGTVSIGSNTATAQTFAGWTGSNGSTAQTNVTIPSGSTGDKSYTAHWTAVAGATPTVTRTGYTCGWNRSSTGTTIEIASGANFPTSYISEGMSSTVNLYAVCTPNTYTIGYTMNGGPNPSTKPTSGTYDADVQISNPGNKTVTVTGNANNSGATVGSATSGTQTFTGWTSTTLGSNAKSGSSTSNYAAWTGTSTKNTYFKNLRESGTVTMVANWSGTVTLPTLSRAGYTCKWYTEATGGSEMGGSGATWTIPSASSTAVTAYARCTINSYTLTINPNGGTYNSTTSNTTVTQNYGTTYSITNNPTKAGYIFTGWTKSGSGSYNYFDTSSTATTTTTVNYDAANSTLPTVYNNNGNGTVTRSMVTDSTATGGYSMKIVTNGSANPGTGGVVLSIYPTTPGRINVLEVKAKIPSGYSLNGVYGLHYKGIGHFMRTDSQTGTGDWKTYYLVHYFGDTGTFSSNAWLYLSGSNNTSVTWYIDSITMRSFTKAQFKSKYTFGDGNGTLTANWSASGSRVTFNTNGGSWNTTYVANWNGNNYYDVSTTTANRYYIYANSYGTHPGSTSYDWTPDSRVISKTGNTFAGWYTAETGGTQVFDADGKLKASVSGYSDANSKWTKYDSNVTLYARWSPVNHTVTYNTTENGGTGTVASQTVGYGSSVPLPTTGASKSGWTFVGWNTDKNATSALSSLTMGLDNVTLYAIYRKEAVTLTANWNANGATLSSTSQSSCQLAAVYNNNTQATSCQVTAPTITRANYNIIGFNTTSTATTNNSSYNTSTGKLTLTSSNTGSTWYAITQAQPQLTATFAANNGATVASTSASCYVVGSNTSCQVTAPSVTPQSGFSHIGFNTTTSATSNSSSYNTSTNKLTISANGTWYPITRAQFTGTFTIQDSNAATQSGGTPSCYKYNGPGSCNIVAPTLTAKSGYTVLGWNTNQNATSASYASGATISISGNTQFYSITKASTAITITFDRNTTNSKATSQTPSGGTASTDTTVTASCEKVNGATSCSVTSPTMAVTAGYHAVGYNTSATATSSSWNVNTAKSVSANATYYAITAPNTYSIKFNANCPTGTTASGTMSDLSMTYGTAKNLTANAFGCTNREFAGWATSASGTVAYNNQAQVNNLTTTNGGTFNLYAKWRLVTPPLPTTSGGTTRVYGSAGDVELTCNDNINMSSYPSGAVKYYSFGFDTSDTSPSSWADNKWDGEQQSNKYYVSANYIGPRYYACKVYVSTSTEASQVTIGTTKTLLTVRNAKISLNANGCGSISGTNPMYVKQGIVNVYTGETNTTSGTIPYTSAEGKTFTGWYDGNTQVINASKVVNASVSGWTDSQKKWLITADKTLTAGCSNVPYTITYALNNGTNNSNNPSSYTVASPAITLAAPTKVLTFHGNANGVNGVSIGNNTTQAQTFAGWSGTGITGNSTSVTIPAGSTGNRSYTAHWTAVAGTVPTVTKEGNTCGWSTSSSGTTIEISSGGSYATSRITEGMASTVNLYAVCTPNTYTITLNNQNANTAGTTTIYEKYGTGYYLTNNNGTLSNQMTTSANGITIPTKDHYVFKGYYTEVNGGGTKYIDENGKLTSNASTSYFTSNGSLYAYWEIQKFLININLYGGSISSETGASDVRLNGDLGGSTPIGRCRLHPITSSYDNVFRFQAWGAQGGSAVNDGVVGGSNGTYIGANGAYTSGYLTLTQDTDVYVYVGTHPSSTSGKNDNPGGFNGGAVGRWDHNDNDSSGGGGGATDFRIFDSNVTVNSTLLTWNNATALRYRVMVAAGGGGRSWGQGLGYGGTLEGVVASPNTVTAGTKATQTSGYAFGYGAAGGTGSTTSGTGGSGGGYWGGSVNAPTSGARPGSGGSSFISGYTGAVAVASNAANTPRTGTNGATCSTGTTDQLCSVHFTGHQFTNAVMYAGNETMPHKDDSNWGNSAGTTSVGNEGNGKASIAVEHGSVSIYVNYGDTIPETYFSPPVACWWGTDDRNTLFALQTSDGSTVVTPSTPITSSMTLSHGAALSSVQTNSSNSLLMASSSRKALSSTKSSAKTSSVDSVYKITLDQQNGSGGTTSIYEKYNNGFYLTNNDGSVSNQMSTDSNGIVVPTKVGKIFGGYYTEANGGGTQYIDSSGKLTSQASATEFKGDGTLYAYWKDVWSENIEYNRTFGDVTCSDVQCAIDQLWDMLSQY